MDVDLKTASVSAMVDVANPAPTDGRDPTLPPPQSAVTPVQPPDGPAKAKKRRVMFADA